MSTDSRQRSPWEAPDCPHCNALDIYVDSSSQPDDWHCFKCDRHFSE